MTEQMRPYGLSVAVASMRQKYRLWNSQSRLWRDNDPRYLALMRLIALAVEEGWYAASNSLAIRKCNGCDWVGIASETVHPKHVAEEQLCPLCNETTC